MPRGPWVALLIVSFVLATGRRVTLTGHTDEIHDVAYSPDDRLPASRSADGTARPGLSVLLRGTYESTSLPPELYRNLRHWRARTGKARALSPVMFATLSVRTRRPASSAARLLAYGLLAISMLVGVVFAHGGACAAVELAETGADTLPALLGPSTARSADATLAGHGWGSAQPEGRCLHRRLPPRHQHGTEQDCSAVSPAGAWVPSPLPTAAAVAGALPVAAPVAARVGWGRSPTAPHRDDLCVLRL
ncbi:hypothetical protein ACI2LC_42465 [Nonomuraea wenchangensis]|uniref:hypothetical protein n=1 Tax=Nonomuraea wenchangensis TaxID=568860 RepID=UPI00385002DC